jgi:hypothetical protein
MSDTKPTKPKLSRQSQISKNLLLWRQVLQVIGAVFIIPSVLIGIPMGFNWLPISWLFLAQYLLVAIAIGIVFCAGSITLTQVIKYRKGALLRRSIQEDAVRNAAGKAEQAAKKAALPGEPSAPLPSSISIVNKESGAIVQEKGQQAAVVQPEVARVTEDNQPEAPTVAK